MNDPQLNPSTDTSTMAKVVYGLYLISIFTGITSVIGVVIAYIYKGESSPAVQTHYQFQIRTFWIAILLSFVAALLTIAIIGFFLFPLIVIWVIIRCVKGFQLLDKNQAHPNPTTWMF